MRTCEELSRALTRAALSHTYLAGARVGLGQSRPDGAQLRRLIAFFGPKLLESFASRRFILPNTNETRTLDLPPLGSTPKAREDQGERQIPAKRGTVALSKHWVPRKGKRGTAGAGAPASIGHEPGCFDEER